jgi:hypothetical protein
MNEARGPGELYRSRDPAEVARHERGPWNEPYDGAVATTEALDADTISELSDATLAALTRDELVRVITAGHVPLPPEYDGRRLLLRDRPALLRMAHLARYACRNLVREHTCRPDDHPEL